MTPYISQIVEVATKLIKYDPNYGAGDDEMDSEDAEMNGVDSDGETGEDEDEYDEEEEYDDDDDVSWKVRRGSVKVLSTAIETRLEMLGSFYKSISPILISRFGEREETVRLEVWNTYTALLKQTGLSAGIVAPASQSGTASAASTVDEGSMANSRAQSPATSLKRKRDGDMETSDS
jgi:cullin-associated NEDD8-dissociated protein 1